MTDVQILTIIVSLAAGVALAMLVLFPLLKKRGIKTDELLHTALTGINGVNSLTDALKVMFPKNAAIGLVDKIVDYTKIAVERAEQLYYINEIAGADRKREAIAFVNQSLELAGIKVTPEAKAIVDGCIEAAVLGLGHYAELPVDLLETGTVKTE